MSRVMHVPSGGQEATLPRLQREDGFTLVELVTVMAILGVVLAALVTSFTTSLRQEADQTRRESAAASARLAIDRLRVDIHCAGGTPQIDQNAYGGFTLTLTENHQGQSGWCPGVIPAGDSSSGVQWCTVPYSGSATRFVLYRYLGLNASECGTGGSGSTFQVDYIAQPPAGWPTNSNTTSTPTSWVGNVWPTAAACAAGHLPTVAIDLSVALDPINYPKQNYELVDEAAIRNANRC